jgi:hypothetical protein
MCRQAAVREQRTFAAWGTHRPQQVWPKTLTDANCTAVEWAEGPCRFVKLPKVPDPQRRCVDRRPRPRPAAPGRSRTVRRPAVVPRPGQEARSAGVRISVSSCSSNGAPVHAITPLSAAMPIYCRCGCVLTFPDDDGDGRGRRAGRVGRSPCQIISYLAVFQVVHLDHLKHWRIFFVLYFLPPR